MGSYVRWSPSAISRGVQPLSSPRPATRRATRTGRINSRLRSTLRSRRGLRVAKPLPPPTSPPPRAGRVPALDPPVGGFAFDGGDLVLATLAPSSLFAWLIALLAPDPAATDAQPDQLIIRTRRASSPGVGMRNRPIDRY
jgi:hypothetical protein